jgi:arsenate reductase (thioredoxin)
MLAKGILFFCVAGSPRSQMAEGLARNILGPGALVVSSAKQPVSPYAAQVMNEVGIDLNQQSSPSFEEIDPTDVGLVITLASDDESPVSVHPRTLRTARRLYWSIPNPTDPSSESSEDTLTRFRVARDRIRGMMELFMSDELSEFQRA